MTGAHLFATAWSPDPSVFGGAAALAVGYLAWTRRFGPRAWLFLAGVLALVYALVGPLDRIGELYLFSVHMVQHLVLILVVPPLLIWGLPPEATRDLLSNRVIARVERWIGRPMVTLPIALASLWLWHLPALYDLALANEGIHAAEHLIFLVTFTMLWWPLLTPVASRRLQPPVAMAYLFAVLVSNSILGAVLTLAPQPLYPFYLHPSDPYGALDLIRKTWNISPMADQQWGGLAMWIPGGLVTIVAILIEFGLWFREPAPEELEASDPGTATAIGPTPPSTAEPRSEGALRRAGWHGFAGTGSGPRVSLPAARRGLLEGAR